MEYTTALYGELIAPDKKEKLVLMNPPTSWERRADQDVLYNKMANIGEQLGGKILAKVMAKRLDCPVTRLAAGAQRRTGGPGMQLIPLK